TPTSPTHEPSPPPQEPAPPSSPPQEQPTHTSESSMTLLNTLMEICATLTQKVAHLELLGIKCSKAFPLLVMVIPMLEHFATYLQNKHYALWEVIEFGDSYKAPPEETGKDTRKFEQWNFKIQQYLQNKHYALWEVIEFGDSYKAHPEETGKGTSSESSARKMGRTVAITTKDMQKRRNDVKGNPQNNIDDKGYWDNGCSRHMTGNISYLFEYEPYDIGYVSFGHGGEKITGKGIIKTGKLEFENVYFVKELKTPRQHNMYSINLNNIVPHKNLTCLVAKASVDESMLWHRRLGHLNFKTMNKLVRINIVKGLPSKCFENDHTCVACLKGKQHKASCKTKLVNSISKPLQTLHMDLFGPTSVSSLNHKWYCLVVTDDFSRFTWTFFLRTKNETGSILRNFITEIKNLKDLKVKIIRCDNGGEFKNQEMNEFCTKKGIRKEFSNVRTPQQNGVAERRNKTLIEAARTMLADAKLPVTFWAKAVNTAYYVQNRVLGKFDAKWDEGTSSTNISGTKDVASQAAKKDVISLRYIALPNWFHEAHMETSNDTIRNSDAQDDSQKEQDCNADVPESSRISNPTATLKVPSADQVEPAVSLTVESKILTVSSPVPTVCLDISPESSSGSRLISKGVFCQKEAPSLGNALTLSNREFEALMHDKFQMSAIGELTFFLGLRVLQKKDGIFLLQDKYVGDILKKFGYSDVRSANNPMDKENPWGKDGPGKDVELHLYRSMIGSLMYLTASRLDIMFAVCACAKHQVTPKECHLHAVKRIFRYLKGHPKLGLWYPEESPFNLVAYSKSDYRGATQDRKSNIRGCQFLRRRTPQQNEVAERRNRTLIKAARTMLADAKLSVTFWAEAVNTACYVQNRVLVNKSQNKTPYELFNSRIHAIGFLRPFGCYVIILNTLDQSGKFDAKGDEEQDCNADVPESSGISNPTATSKVLLADQVEPAVSLTVEYEILTVSSPVPTVYLEISPESSSGPRLILKGVISQKEAPSLGNALTLSNRFEDTFGDTTNVVTLNEVEADLSNMETSIPVSPTPTFKIHKDHPKSQIIGPVDTPVQTRHKSKDMEEQRVRPIRIKWVLKNKKDERGIVIRNKARLVRQGYTLEEGINYEELFAPVARIEAIRLFLAYASFMGFIVYQMHAKSAFLYGTIDEEVYVMQPPGFQDSKFPERVYKVGKAMYGLHQAP
nr:hypothetical protein [Tanacetum cinerariifolium]